MLNWLPPLQANNVNVVELMVVTVSVPEQLLGKLYFPGYENAALRRNLWRPAF
jgi:hypothetical protein